MSGSADTVSTQLSPAHPLLWKEGMETPGMTNVGPSGGKTSKGVPAWGPPWGVRGACFQHRFMVGGGVPGRTGIRGAIHSRNNIWLLLVGFLQVYWDESACPGYQQ